MDTGWSNVKAEPTPFFTLETGNFTSIISFK
jgi:hypothetical protein